MRICKFFHDCQQSSTNKARRVLISLSFFSVSKGLKLVWNMKIWSSNGVRSLTTLFRHSGTTIITLKAHPPIILSFPRLVVMSQHWSESLHFFFLSLWNRATHHPNFNCHLWFHVKVTGSHFPHVSPAFVFQALIHPVFFDFSECLRTFGLSGELLYLCTLCLSA